MSRIIITLGLFIIFSSCSSTHITKPTIPQYAPKGYKAKGVIKYLNNGADFVINNRREDAFKEMYNQCAGEYKIIAEGNQKENPQLVQGLGNSTMILDYDYWYISYECTKN